MDSNFAQFARAGNPWVSEKDQEEMRAEMLPEKGGRKYAKIRPAFVEKPREIPGAADARMALEMRQFIRARKGGSRTVVAAEKTVNLPTFLAPPAVSELAPRDISACLAEPVHYPAPRPVVDKDDARAKRAAHDIWMAQQLEQALAAVKARIEARNA